MTPLSHAFILKYCSLEIYATERTSAGLRGIGLRGAEVPMFIEIQKLERQPIVFREEFGPGEIDLGEDVRQRTPLKSEGRADLVAEHHGKHKIVEDIRLQGGLSTSLELPCARCLDPVIQEVERKFDLLYRPLGVDAGEKEAAATGTEAEISYYQGDGLLLEDALREQVLLSVPLRVLCREDCKGLCPTCGKNLNAEQCSCANEVHDARWTALKEIRSKLDQ